MYLTLMDLHRYGENIIDTRAISELNNKKKIRDIVEHMAPRGRISQCR